MSNFLRFSYIVEEYIFSRTSFVPTDIGRSSAKEEGSFSAGIGHYSSRKAFKLVLGSTFEKSTRMDLSVWPLALLFLEFIPPSGLLQKRGGKRQGSRMAFAWYLRSGLMRVATRYAREGLMLASSVSSEDAEKMEKAAQDLVKMAKTCSTFLYWAVETGSLEDCWSMESSKEAGNIADDFYPSSTPAEVSTAILMDDLAYLEATGVLSSFSQSPNHSKIAKRTSSFRKRENVFDVYAESLASSSYNPAGLDPVFVLRFLLDVHRRMTTLSSMNEPLCHIEDLLALHVTTFYDSICRRVHSLQVKDGTRKSL